MNARHENIDGKQVKRLPFPVAVPVAVPAAVLAIFALFALVFGAGAQAAGVPQGAPGAPSGVAAPAAVPAPGGSPALTRPPRINARSAALIDQATGTILYAKNPDLKLPPASLTKLVTLHVAFGEIAAGRLSYDELVDIDPKDCSPYIPYGSSIMYLHPGMKVSVRDLMLGAAVVSGNDAAYALARRISGSNEAFAQKMNDAVKELGLDGMVFVEPSGLSEYNLVTARQFAQFCRKYMELHPEALRDFHSVKSIDFPRPEHAAPGFVPEGRIVQYNRNPLVFSYEGADGLKTGYIIEVGFNMAATAEREGSRFIAVSLGGTGSTYSGGGLQRSKDATGLLDWAFENFRTISLDPGEITEPRAWFGGKRSLPLVPASANAVTVPVSELAKLTVHVQVPASVDAPVEKGRPVGKIVYSLSGREYYSIDLVAAESVERGGFFRQVWDGIAKFLSRVFGRI